ncbi:MAG: hypothetical protein ACR2OA_14895 [Rubripirellula sp.]
MREKPNRFSIQVGANTLGGSGATGQPPAAGITATGSGVPAILAAAAAGAAISGGGGSSVASPALE